MKKKFLKKSDTKKMKSLNDQKWYKFNQKPFIDYNPIKIKFLNKFKNYRFVLGKIEIRLESEFMAWIKNNFSFFIGKKIR